MNMIGKDKQYWDCDFYKIYMIDGEKWITVEGYYYDEGEDDGYGTSRNVMFGDFDMSLKEFLSDEFDYDLFQNQLTEYVDELKDYEAIRQMNEWYDEYNPLPYDKLTMETPCGYYVDWKGE